VPEGPADPGEVPSTVARGWWHGGDAIARPDALVQASVQVPENGQRHAADVRALIDVAPEIGRSAPANGLGFKDSAQVAANMRPLKRPATCLRGVDVQPECIAGKQHKLSGEVANIWNWLVCAPLSL